MIPTTTRTAGRFVVAILVIVNAVACSQLATTTSPSTSSNSIAPTGPQTVAVYLNAGGVEMFKYEGFTNYPTTIRENGSCTSYSFVKGDVTEIRFYGRSTASCSNNTVYWEYFIVLNGRSITGHGNNPTDAFVRGSDLDSGRSKTVRYENISSIQFNR